MASRILRAPEARQDLLGIWAYIAGESAPAVAYTVLARLYGAMEVIAQGTWHQFAWTPLVQAAALWTAIFFVALYLYDTFFPR